MVDEITLDLYSGSEIEKNFTTQPSVKFITKRINENFKKGIINETLFKKALQEIDIIKSRPLNPKLTLVRVWDKRGFYTLKYKNLNKEKIEESDEKINKGDKVIYRGEQQTVVNVLHNGFIELKDGDGKVSRRSLKNIKFTHPERKEGVGIKGEYTLQDYHSDGSESVHKMIRDNSSMKELNNKQIDSVLKQFYDSGLNKNEMSVDLKFITESDYKNNIGGKVAPYGTSGRKQQTIAMVKKEYNDKLIENKAHEIKNKLKLEKFEYGLNSEKVKAVTKEIIRLSSEGVDIYKEIEDRAGDLREHPNRALSFRFNNIMKNKIGGSVSFDKYGRITVKGSVTIDDEVVNSEGKFPFRINKANSIYINSNKIKSLKDLRINNVDDLIINSNSIESLNGSPEVVENVSLMNCGSLKNFKGFPKKINQRLDVRNTPINSLQGMPNVGSTIKLVNTEIPSLNGIQNKIYGNLDISHNKNLENFDGAPDEIMGNLIFNNTPIKEINNFPKKLGAFETNNKSTPREEFLKISKVQYPERKEAYPTKISRNFTTQDKEFRSRWFLDYL